MDKIYLVQLLLFATIIFTATSCATITSGRSHVMSISSELPNTEVIINHSNRYELPARVAVIRSREDLNFTVLQNDTVLNDTVLRPRLSTAFWLGNVFTGFPVNNMFLPVGHLIDLTNQNRFTYRRFIHIDSSGNVQQLRRTSSIAFRPHQQGDFNILLALPYLNFFHLNHQNEPSRILGGFIGGGIGVEYFYRDSRSLQLRSDVITSLPPLFLLPLVMMLGGPDDLGSALNISVTDNFHINRFRLGYGLNFARNNWNRHGYGYWEIPPWELEEDEKPVWIQVPGRFKTNNMLGLALSAHYRLTNHFHLGVIYRPSFLNLSRPRLMYEHSISIDLKWKIPLRR